jgi:hypothetical protein
MFVFTFLN